MSQTTSSGELVGSGACDWSSHKPPPTCLEHLLKQQRAVHACDLRSLAAAVRTQAEEPALRASAEHHGLTTHEIHAILLCPVRQ